MFRENKNPAQDRDRATTIIRFSLTGSEQGRGSHETYIIDLGANVSLESAAKVKSIQAGAPGHRQTGRFFPRKRWRSIARGLRDQAYAAAAPKYSSLRAHVPLPVSAFLGS
jgi:hypothetical protein